MNHFGTAVFLNLWISLGLVVALGCSDPNESPGQSGMPASEAAGAGGTAGTVDTPASGDGDAGTADSEADDAQLEPIEDLPSTQSVRIEFTNDGEAPVWLLDWGEQCTRFAVESYENGAWTALPIGANSLEPDDICCEGGCDWSNLWHYFVEVPPGQSASLEWDARAVVLSDDTYACAYGVEYRPSALQPVAPGRYRIALGLRLEVEAPDCQEEDKGVVPCTVIESGSFPPQIESMCEVPESVTVEFQLPATGDVDLSVSYP
jgi:hypothetical protein